jgi:hypothetical protein
MRPTGRGGDSLRSLRSFRPDWPSLATLWPKIAERHRRQQRFPRAVWRYFSPANLRLVPTYGRGCSIARARRAWRSGLDRK